MPNDVTPNDLTPNELRDNGLRLEVAGFSFDGWDELEVDSQIDLAADAWRFNVLMTPIGWPTQIQAGAKALIYFNNELILTGVVDRINPVVSRGNLAFSISGRDLIGQFVDCSVPLLTAKNMTIGAIYSAFIASDIGEGYFDTGLESSSRKVDNIKDVVKVEPGETIWDALQKACASFGLYAWALPDGTIAVGNPFTDFVKQPKPIVLQLNRQNTNNTNNVLSLDYCEDVSGVYSDITVLHQDYATAKSQKTQLKATGRALQMLPIPRSLVVVSGDVTNVAYAQKMAQKIQHDNNLNAFNLVVELSGWDWQGVVWQAGWQLSVQCDVWPNASGDWVVLGRTLLLSRKNGKTTRLTLKRKGDWMNPIGDPPQQQAKNKRNYKSELAKS